jgi:hypothetical protein
MDGIMIENKKGQSENYCKLSKYKESYNAVISIFPPTIFDELSPKNIGMLVDSIWESWIRTKQITEKEILNEGCIWDGEELREICPKK